MSGLQPSPQVQQQQQMQRAQLAHRFGQLSDTLLTRRQEELLAGVAHFAEARRPAPAPLAAALQQSQSQQQQQQQQQALPGVPLPAEPIDTLAQFNAWAASVENGKEEDEDEKEEERASQKLGRAVERIADVRAQCGQWATAVHDALELRAQVAERTAALHGRAGALTAEQHRAEALAEALERRLWYFDQVEPLTRRLFAAPAAVAVGSVSFAQPASASASALPGATGVLADLDQCVAFLAQHRRYREADAYLARYRQLQARALGSLKQHIVDSLRATSTVAAQQKQQQQQQQQQRVPPKAMCSVEAVEAASAARQMRVLATRLRPHCAEIERRAVPATAVSSPRGTSGDGTSELAALLSDCHSAYFHQRRLLLSDAVAAAFSPAALAAAAASAAGTTTPDLPGQVRAACNLATRLCKAELGLYTAFFKTPSALLRKLIEWISSSLEYSLRSMLLRANDVDALCAATSVLRSGIGSADTSTSATQEPASDAELAPLSDSFASMLRDAQERLTFLAQRAIQTEIVAFVPTQQDLDYPAKIMQDAQQQQQVEDATDIAAVLHSVYATWYQPLQRTLMLLSKLYLTVDMSVFEGLAQEAVEACIKSLESGATQIGARNQLDGQLFLVRHLLALREQIAPFEASFAVTSVALDFSHTREELRKVLSSGDVGRLFRLDTIAPRVSTDRKDSRQLLDKKLSETLERLIVGETKRLTRPMLSLLVQASSFEKVQSALPNPQKLSAQPWATEKCFEDVATGVASTLRTEVPQLAERLSLYLTQSQARAVLLPIRDNVLDSWESFTALHLRTHSPLGAAPPTIEPLPPASAEEEGAQEASKPPEAAVAPIATVVELADIFDRVVPSAADASFQ